MSTATIPTSLFRVEVRPADDAGDPRAQRLVREAASIGVSLGGARTAKVYFIEAALDDEGLDAVCARLLCDPVLERFGLGASALDSGWTCVEVHPLPGVMDPVAASVADAAEALVGVRPRVSTGWRYDLRGVGPDEATRLAERLLANTVVHEVHARPWTPDRLPTGSPYAFTLRHVPIRDLDDAALTRLSRENHLFLSLDEMRAVRDEFRRLGREPTDVELETLAQTWSEHCVHKTLKSTIMYRHEGAETIDWNGRPGHEVNTDGSITIHNLLKSTVAAATFELIEEGVDWTLSVFTDNAGVIVFDDQHAVCVKVETHNHPSALEPYGGSATGIGGCIRDVIGTGLAARPIANTDVFCVAPPTLDDVPAGCLHPRRILSQVVAGVRDYGNRMGIPTINGAVSFDERFVGNPLVFCGCVGIMPRDRIAGEARGGDRIIALGGRTGRDGIHGATFSSAELTDTHADEFSHAVQIGNAIEEKRVLDAVLQLRDGGVGGACLYTAITDCGAGGFSSAVGEMGEKLGAEVRLDRAPLKYEGLSYTEIWISEAQERMVLAVPEQNLPALARICEREHVEWADLGHFGTLDRELVLHYGENEVGRLPMAFLHEGIPTPTRGAVWAGRGQADTRAGEQGQTPERRGGAPGIAEALLALLREPSIASKHWIVRQYDHEVQGNTVVKPLVGPGGRGPGDASVIEPVPGTGRGLAMGCGLQIGVGDPSTGGDPYQMAMAGIDECVRNLVCVGADPSRIAILDNFCWPSCVRPENLGSLVRAAEGCYDGAKAYRTPFVSGKDSLNNQFTTEQGRTIAIPPTLLITGIGVVPDITRCVTSDAKRSGNTLMLVSGARIGAMRGSAYARRFGMGHLDASATELPEVDLARGPALARLVHELIVGGVVRSAHDVSEGGTLVALAEMLIGAWREDQTIGATVELGTLGGDASAWFAEPSSTIIIEVEPGEESSVIERAKGAGLAGTAIARLTPSGNLELRDASGRAVSTTDVPELIRAWRSPLDWG